MAFLDAGARESLSDVVSKVLRKVLSQPEGKIEELDDTLLTWEILYSPGLITHYTRSSNRIIRHYSPDPYKKEIYSCISYIVDKLVHSILYLGKQLKCVKRDSRSMPFKLLKLKCSECQAIQTRIVHTFTRDVFYDYSYIIRISTVWHLTIRTSLIAHQYARVFSHLRDRRWQSVSAFFLLEIWDLLFKPLLCLQKITLRTPCAPVLLCHIRKVVLLIHRKEGIFAENFNSKFEI